MTSTSIDVLSGLSSSAAVKVPCRAATTAAIALSGLQTIDGIALAAGDRVLVKDQTDTTQNGVYVAATTSWRRGQDFDGARDVAEGTIIRVNEGSTWAGFFFALTTSGTVVFGSTSITFATTGGPGTISAAMLPVVSAATLATARTAMVVLGTAGGSMTGAINEAYLLRGDIPSGFTLDLSVIPANFIDLNANSMGTITGFGVLPAGACRTLRFTGTTPATLANSANLVTPAGASITVGTNDKVHLRSLGAGAWDVVGYQRNTGAPIYGAALKADMQTATDNTKFVTALQQQQHPSALKAYGLVTVSGSVVVGSYPAGAVSTKNATGNYTVTLGVTMASTNYAVGLTLDGSSNLTATIASRTATQLQILIFNAATGAAADSSIYYDIKGQLA
jgi:hypothetical protein